MADNLPADVTLWRTSHLGGHRFAPTALLLPGGTLWGHLDAATGAQIVRGDGDPALLAPLLRGTCGLPEGGVQLLEQHAFATLGWSWLTRTREGRAEADGTIRLVGRSANDAVGFAGAVHEGRTLPVLPCREPATGMEKTDTELLLHDVRALAEAELTPAPQTTVGA